MNKLDLLPYVLKEGWPAIIDHYNLLWIAPLLAECRVCLCGGALLSFHNNRYAEDLDLYLPNIDCLATIEDKLRTNSFYVVYKTDNAITYEIGDSHLTKNYNRIQLIINPAFYTGGTLLGTKKLLEHFDFRLCMMAYSFYGNLFLEHEYSASDLLRNRLVFNADCSGKNVIPYRLIKYLKKGYSISYIDFLAMKLEFQEYVLGIKDLNSPEYEKTLSKEALMVKLGEKIKQSGTIDQDDPAFILELGDLYNVK